MVLSITVYCLYTNICNFHVCFIFGQQLTAGQISTNGNLYIPIKRYPSPNQRNQSSYVVYQNIN